MFVEENQVRIVVRDEVNLQAFVGVSMSPVFDKLSSFR